VEEKATIEEVNGVEVIEEKLIEMSDEHKG
jgi:hypothetical protein